MRIKVINSSFSNIKPGMEADAELQGTGCFATFKDVPNPVPGYTTRGDVTTFLQEGEFQVLPDPVVEKQLTALPQLQTLENKVQDPVGDLIQLMRTCSMAQVRARLELELAEYPEDYYVISCFYSDASKIIPLKF